MVVFTNTCWNSLGSSWSNIAFFKLFLVLVDSLGEIFFLIAFNDWPWIRIHIALVNSVENATWLERIPALLALGLTKKEFELHKKSQAEFEAVFDDDGTYDDVIYGLQKQALAKLRTQVKVICKNKRTRNIKKIHQSAMAFAKNLEWCPPQFQAGRTWCFGIVHELKGKSRGKKLKRFYDWLDRELDESPRIETRKVRQKYEEIYGALSSYKAWESLSARVRRTKKLKSEVNSNGENRPIWSRK